LHPSNYCLLKMKDKFLKVRMFGVVAEKTGESSLDIPFVIDTKQLTALLFEKYPQLDGIKFALAVDKQIVHENIPLHEGAEVALLPPFSGG